MDLDPESILVNIEEKSNGVFVAYINGNIICNISGTPVRKAVERLLKAPKPKIIFNIHDVRYLDSYSYGWLTKVYKDAKEKGGMFVISDPNEDIFSLMQMLNFDRTVPIYQTEEEAIKALSK